MFTRSNSVEAVPSRPYWHTPHLFSGAHPAPIRTTLQCGDIDRFHFALWWLPRFGCLFHFVNAEPLGCTSHAHAPMSAPLPRRRRKVCSSKSNPYAATRSTTRTRKSSHGAAQYDSSSRKCSAMPNHKVRTSIPRPRGFVRATMASQGQLASLDVRINRAMCLRSSHSHSRCVPSSFLSSIHPPLYSITFLFLSPRWRHVLHGNPCRHTGPRNIRPHGASLCSLSHHQTFLRP